ncbi:MAG: class I SAM-dependent methyltransferase [Candidatus Peribacteraceae bacterium]|jgi:ubiquinone/menaquinone biosynthesis C-methylase UbiE
MVKNSKSNDKCLPEWGSSYVYSVDEEKAIKATINKAKDAFLFADLYDQLYPGYSGDLEYYKSKGSQGRVLYLGVGTGRILIPILQNNPNVLGIDKSHEMLQNLIKKLPNLKANNILFKDIEKAKLPSNSFDVILAPYSFFQFIQRDHFPRILLKLNKALKPGGKLYTDIFSPFWTDFRSRHIEKAVRTYKDNTEALFYLHVNHQSQEADEYACVYTPNGKEIVLKMHMQYYYPLEVMTLFKKAHFTKTIISGGYHNERFSVSGSDLMVIEAIK